MWELYSLWTWFLTLYTDFLEDHEEAGIGGDTGELARRRLASLVTFGMVGTGAVTCIFVGWIGTAMLLIDQSIHQVLPFAFSLHRCGG